MNQRTLKIEAEGDYWKKKVSPKIRLRGQWLERAGFKPGSHISVTRVANGVMELRSDDAALALNETASQSHAGQ